MTDGFREPTTEAEAQEQKGFLERGAETTLEVVASFEATAVGDVTIDKPVALTFEVSADDLLGRLAENANMRAYVEIGVARVVGADRVIVNVFVANPEASPQQAAEDPRYVGALAFFPASDGEHAGHNAGDEMRFVYPLLDRMLKPASGQSELVVDLSLEVVRPDLEGEPPVVTIGSSNVRIVNSSVKTG